MNSPEVSAPLSVIVMRTLPFPDYLIQEIASLKDDICKNFKIVRDVPITMNVNRPRWSKDSFKLQVGVLSNQCILDIRSICHQIYSC